MVMDQTREELYYLPGGSQDPDNLITNETVMSLIEMWSIEFSKDDECD
jgi:hypothetical protein